MSTPNTWPVTVTDGDRTEPLLSVRNLSVDVRTSSGVVHAVIDLSFDVRSGEILAIVGESGSGKSVTAASILGLLPKRNFSIVSGEIFYQGRDLLKSSPRELRAVRRGEIGMVFQDPMSSLNPVMTVGRQLMEEMRVKGRKVTRRVRRELAWKALDSVRIPSAKARASQYAHEFSGGMRQRVMIAMALRNGPNLLIADEPTTALDVTIQSQILSLIDSERHKRGIATLLITHDLGVVAEMADRVLVMREGVCVERGSVFDIFDRPSHPYTKKLLAARPGSLVRTGEEPA